MKLTKKLEKEVMEVYEAYWDSYLNGDVAAISTLLDESYTQVGSAETEVFANKKDAVQFLHDTIDQVAGKLEMRNRSTRLEKQNNFLLFHELCDIYALAEPEWIFYSKFRATTIMEEKKDGWKIIHQHSSFPDARTDEGENIAIDKIAEENQLLREAIKRRTIELEYKNRELEIEASLERVRAQAMAMTKPDDTLSICEILFKEFQTLGFTEIRNSMINIHNDAQGTFVNYDFSEEIGKSINHLTYNIHPVIEKQIKQIRAANDAFSETIFTGEDLESWKEFRRNVGEKDDPRINNISELYYYFYSIGTGSIGISTFSSIDQEKLELLKRFRNVFNLSYQRYIDIALAEAQTREAQIELGLERVRARAMAMQKSDELAELVDTVFKELTKLDFALTWCMINIIDEPSLSNTVWTVNAETGKMPESFHMKFEDYPFHDAMMKGYQERKTKFIYVMEGIEKKVYDKYLFNETAFSKVPEEAQASSRAMEKYVCSFTFSNFGGLQTVGDEPLSDENLNILSRFGKVFDLTYTRFNDLKLAEAQSKEAQIELALERIRARTMAMQKSDELREAVLVIYEQLQHLNFEAQACNIIIIDKDTGDMQFWVSGFSQEIYPESYYIPRLNHHYHEDQLTAWREGVKYAVYEYSGKEKKSFDKIFFTQTDFKNVPENAKQFMIGLESVKLSTAFFSYGSLQVLGQEAISEEKVKILQRFTKVFEQTYTRFLDLKKAEAQARESQIEAALERVRAKAMTMHKTDDLSSAVATIFDELDKLNLGMLRCGIGILDKEKRSSDVWTTTISDQGKTVQVSGDESMDIHPLLQGAFNAWLHQKDFSYLLQGQDLNNYYKALLGVNFKLPDSQSKISEMHGLQQFYYVATFQAGGLFAFRETAFPDEAKIVIKRFADVFNFTYTRFQDLQQAEAQAREAQIELALERVRAKTMAMQHSDELGEAASLLFKQISDLGISTWTCGFHIWLEDDISSIAWMAKPDGSIQTPFRAPHTEDSYFKHIYEARQRGEDFFVMETAGEALEEKYHYLNNLPGVKKILNIGKTGFQIPKLQITHCAFFSNGYLMFITLESFPEAWDIFKRFAKIFEQTYTRFLDLQKAETQAREAQIEAALERVRSRMMAMHRSDELAETTAHLFAQLNQLGIKPYRCNIGIIDQERESCKIWSTTNKGEVIPSVTSLPLTETPSFNNIYNAWKNKQTRLVFKLIGEQRVIHTKYVSKFGIFNEYMPGTVNLEQISNEAAIFSNFFFKQGFIFVHTVEELSEADLNIIQRFTNVFEQTYTRFLDLQKAEVQAREAQIELALERVRARTMAMQKSDELPEAANLLFQQVQSLGMPAWSAGYCIWDDDKKAITLSMSSEGVIQPSLRMPLTEDPTLKHFLEAHQQGESFFVEEVGGEALKDHYIYLRTLPGVKDSLDEIEKAGYPVPTFQINHCAYFSKGFLLFITYEPVLEAHDIFKRFAGVFEQTYTRFLDLQNAEAQAREAQIEAALERVRSRTMGMQKSEELKEVIQVVYEQFVHLNIHIEHTGFIMDYKARDDMHIWLADRHEVPSEVTIPYFDCAHWNSFNEAKEKGIDFFTNHLTFEEKNKFYQDLFMLIPGVPEETLEYYFSCPGLAISTVLLENVGLYIENFSGIHYSDEENNTLMRFGKVFQQTYTRFLDLLKAEAQAREAQIEMALERVRSRTMAMQKSDELAETAYVLYEQFGFLGENPEQLTIGIIDETHKIWEFWLTLGGNQINHVFKASIDEPIVLNKSYIAWKERKKSIVIDISGDELKAYYNFFKNLPGYKEFNDFKNNQIPEHRRVINMAFFSNGSLSLSSPEPKPAETIQLLERLAGVLEQTYTRFLDLQKAEVQAREAQIETALERVRSRTMAMYDSSELLEAVAVFFHQFKSLGLLPSEARTYFCHINTETHTAKVWMTHRDGKVMNGNHITPLNKSSSMVSFYEAWKRKEPLNIRNYTGEALAEYMQFLLTLPHVSKDEGYKNLFENPPERIIMTDANFLQGNIGVMTYEPLSQEALDTLVRFAKVFELTYTRFLDLQNAEVQAREAQIEAALERVRSKAMAMHSSEDLAITVDTFFSELNALGVTPHRCGVGIVDAETRTTDIHANTTTHANEIKKVVGKLKLSGHPVLDSIFENWKLQKEYHPVLHGNEIIDYYKVMDPQVKFPDFADDETQYGYYFYFKEGGVFAWTDKELTERDLQIFRRYTSVLSLTYRRYMDLIDAEAQAREAQIEASLERVRTVAMSMNKSNDLLSICEVSFKEFQKLGFDNLRNTIIHILNDEKGFFLDYDFSDAMGGSISNIDYNSHPVVDDYLKQIKSARDAFAEVVIERNQLNDWRDFRRKSGQRDDPRLENIPALHYYFHSIGVGDIGISAFKPIDESQIKILKRFRNVFDLAYRRYTDITKAEAQAREAQVQLALERVRARTMAMHQSDELAETAAVVFKQLMNLGIEPNRIYITIIKDETGIGEFWITDEDGSKVSSGFTADLNENVSFKKMYTGWKEQKKSIRVDMQGNELEEYFKHLSSLNVPFKGGLSQKRRVQNIAYFSQGFIGIASPDSQPEETTNLLERFAAVFNLTYTRFNDLQQAEAQNKIIQAENERKSEELEEARQLQLSMLPKELPNLPNLDIAVYMQTATEVGGDYYDFQVGMDGTLTTIIGDATGHGMKAGTVVTITKSLFNSMAASENILSTFDKISQVIKGMKFRQLAMCLIMIKIKGNRLSMSSAAMPPALIYRKKNKMVEEILLKAMPLGTMKKFPYKKIESHLNSGDRILLYSDGLPELANESNEMYGYDRIITEFHSVGDKEPEEIVNHLKNSASQWANGKEPDDDVTFVVIKVK